MATVFKSRVTNDIGDSYTSITPVLGAGVRHTVLGVSIYNVSGSNNQAFLKLVKAGEASPNDEAHICHNLALPASTGFEFEAGNKFILEPGDGLLCKSASGSGVLEVVYNYLEIS